MSFDPAVLVVTRVFQAAPEALFEAWTEPALMMQWFHAGESWTTPHAEADLRVGGRWSVEMKADTGRIFRPFGSYRVIEPPTRLIFTLHPYGDPAYETLITLRFRALGKNCTELTLTQEGLRNDGDRSDHEGGWQGCLRVLAAQGSPS